MKTIQHTILRTDIEDAVALNTAYAGVKQDGGDGSEYSRVATVDKDSRLLSRFLSDTVSRATDRLREFITEAAYDGTTLQLTLQLPDRFDTSMQDLALSSLQAALAAGVTARWMRLANPARAAEWEIEAAAQLSETERRLYHRQPPRRQLPTPN